MTKRQKTYLSPEDQWDWTAMYYLEHSYYGKRGSSQVGINACIRRVVQPHRLFVPGDFVLCERTHGAGRRWPTYAVSRKGYKIRGLFVSFWETTRHYPKKKRVKGVRSEKRLREIRHTYYESHQPGCLMDVELPESLVGLPPDSPSIRRFIVESHARGEAQAG